jgi:DNA-binding FadR family transcriptional regulator
MVHHRRGKVILEARAALESLAMSERYAVLHRRILEISRHEVARDICARLHSQVVRFEFRTVLAPGRSTKSLAGPRAIVQAIAAGDRRRAQRAMREHLTKVAAALTAVATPERIAL